MRLAIIVIVAIFVAAPALLALFQPGKALLARLIWAVAIFISPFLIIGIVNAIPALNGEAARDASFWRAFGVLFSTAAFIVPWCMYAVASGRRS